MEHVEYQQRLLSIIGEIKEPSFVEEYYVERWRNEHDAIVTCWAKRRVRWSVRGAAEKLSIPTSHLSNILSGKKYLPHDLRINFQLLCGNWAIRQYEGSGVLLRDIKGKPGTTRTAKLKSKGGQV